MMSIVFWLVFWLAVGAGFAAMLGRFAILWTILIAGSGVSMMVGGILLRPPV